LQEDNQNSYSATYLRSTQTGTRVFRPFSQRAVCASACCMASPPGPSAWRSRQQTASACHWPTASLSHHPPVAFHHHAAFHHYWAWLAHARAMCIMLQPFMFMPPVSQSCPLILPACAHLIGIPSSCCHVVHSLCAASCAQFSMPSPCFSCSSPANSQHRSPHLSARCSPQSPTTPASPIIRIGFANSSPPRIVVASPDSTPQQQPKTPPTTSSAPPHAHQQRPCRSSRRLELDEKSKTIDTAILAPASGARTTSDPNLNFPRAPAPAAVTPPPLACCRV